MWATKRFVVVSTCKMSKKELKLCVLCDISQQRSRMVVS